MMGTANESEIWDPVLIMESPALSHDEVAVVVFLFLAV